MHYALDLFLQKLEILLRRRPVPVLVHPQLLLAQSSLTTQHPQPASRLARHHARASASTRSSCRFPEIRSYPSALIRTRIPRSSSTIVSSPRIPPASPRRRF